MRPVREDFYVDLIALIDKEYFDLTASRPPFSILPEYVEDGGQIMKTLFVNNSSDLDTGFFFHDTFNPLTCCEIGVSNYLDE